jgi:hypothetical protein
MRCGADHAARRGSMGRAPRRTGRRRCVPRLRRRLGSSDVRPDRGWGRARAEGLLAAGQRGGAGRPAVPDERGSAGDDHRRSHQCRGRERHRRQPRQPAPVALPRIVEAPIHQRCDVECCVRIAPSLCSAVPAFRLCRVAPRFEEHAEVERSAGVPGDGSLAIRGRSRIQIAPLLQQQAQLESFLGSLVISGRPVIITDHGSGQLGFS